MEPITLTPEIKQAMLGLLPFSIDAKIEFVPERFSQRPGVPPSMIPTFILRPLAVNEKKEALKLVKNLSTANEEDLSERTRKNVIGWKNLFDLSTGQEMAFVADNAGAAKKELFEQVPRTIVGDILFYLVKVAGLVDIEILSLRY